MENEDYVVRLEEKKDWSEVENLTREAFWNKYQPGCSEHYVLHQYRSNPAFVKQLDYIIEEKGRIIAHIMYSQAEIQSDKGHSVPILVFGPISVLPEFQGQGYGSKLIRFTMNQARSLGYGAIAITGDPNYYKRFGFVSGHSMQIYYAPVSQAEEFPFFMVKELKVDYLKGITGTYHDPKGYLVDEADVEKFDANFPPKEKKVQPGQLN